MIMLCAPLCATAQPVAATGAEVDAFVKADRNKDAMLTPAEFRVFVTEMAKAGQSTARQIRLFRAYGYAFKVVDKNRDGLASPQELRSSDTDHRAKN